MDYKDYYKMLGVSKTADEKEIKAAFRKLAQQYHPDKNPGDKKAEDKFKEINEAYQVLSDSEKRQKYDQFGSNWEQFRSAGGDPGGFDWTRWANAGAGTGAGTGGFSGRRMSQQEFEELFRGTGTNTSGFSDFFNMMFGGAAGSAAFQQAMRMDGQDLVREVEISLEEVLTGTSRLLRKGDRTLTAKIPAGAKDGSKLRFAGEGTTGVNGGKAGDLYLVVRILPHERFERSDADLICQQEVDLYTALLGGTMAVPTLEGSFELKIQPETQNGQKYRLRGRGLPVAGTSERGNLYVLISVRLPKNLSEQEKSLVRQLAQLRGTH
jgi:curved DNA-binding protein